MIKELEDIFKEHKEKDGEESETKISNIIEIHEDQQEATSTNINESYVSFEKKLVYLRISKCASSSIGEYLSTQSDFIPTQFPYQYDIERIQGYNIFTVIRDPKSRWISGLNEFLRVYNKHGSKLETYVEQELKRNKFIFDGHTQPQIDSLPYDTDLPFISNMILLRLDKNLNQKISSLLGEDVQLKFKNVSLDDYTKINNLPFCIKMFETYCKKNPKYYQTYELDYRLFNISK
jgi:hypothetical protein